MSNQELFLRKILHFNRHIGVLDKAMKDELINKICINWIIVLWLGYCNSQQIYYQVTITIWIFINSFIYYPKYYYNSYFFTAIVYTVRQYQ